MPGKFVIAEKTEVKVDDFGTSSWLSNPPSTGARQLTVIDVNLDPGKGHNFHNHPDQEEVILVVTGEVEQWVDREKRILGPRRLRFHSGRRRACNVQHWRESSEDHRNPRALCGTDRL
jgi:uncharacterized cupin superfamily protein